MLATKRLYLSKLCHDDSDFIQRLVNEPAFLEHIGDKNITDHESAINYLDGGPIASYRERGIGLLKVSLIDTGEPIGVCGLVFRDYLPMPDLGFALLSCHNRRGYGFESANAVLAHVKTAFQIDSIAAITSKANVASIALLEKLGFVLSKEEPEIEEVKGLHYFEYSLG